MRHAHPDAYLAITAGSVFASASSITVGPLVVLKSSSPAKVVERLIAQGILLSARQDGVRFSFHAYNTMDDVNIALDALKALADHMVRE